MMSEVWIDELVTPLGICTNTSIFDARESIWTYNCPCPSLSKHASHVCRFKRTPANPLVASDLDAQARLDNQFNTLRSLFYLPRKREEEVVATPPPQQEYKVTPTTKRAVFCTFIVANKMMLRTKQCFRSHRCRTIDCQYAHSLDEMLAPFRDARTRQFFIETAVIKDRSYAPHNKEITVNENAAFVCCSAHCRHTQMSMQMVYHTDSTFLQYPYIIIECGDCKRVSNVPVYH